MTDPISQTDAGATGPEEARTAGFDDRYWQLVASVSDWVWEVDASGRYTYASSRVRDILGYEPEEVIGRTPFDFMPAAEAARVRAEFGELLARHAPLTRLENLNVHRDGHEVLIETTGLPVIDAAGRLTGYRGVDRDITERRRAETALRESEERYRLMFESSPLPMWVFDLETLRFLAVNEQAIRQYGFQAEEFASMTLRDIRPPEDVPTLLEMTRHLEVESAPQTDLVRHRRRDGAIIDVEVTGHGIRFEGRRARLVVVRDVTERLALERQLRQSQKMEAIGQLAGGVAHDFNNLLTAILGYSDLLLSDHGATEELCEIKAAAERAARLTRQLLAFSRKEISRRERVELALVVEGMESMLRRLLPESIALRLDISSRGVVNADPGQIEQILLNLIVNARDAMPEGGRLRIAIREVDDIVELTVSDNGVGMDAVTVERIFEPFFTTKSAEHGTGLGLSTVYGIVKQHGGQIRVRSAPGEGATFLLVLPRFEAPDSKAADRPRDADPCGGSETILLAEDDAAVRRLTSALLRRRGYTVIEAAHPEEALQAARNPGTSFALLLTDIVMPGMSGTTLASELRKIRPDVKVLYVSGHTDETIRRAPGAGTDGFLRKPFTPAALLDKVRTALRG